MATLGLGEGVARAVISYLSGGIADKLATVSARFDPVIPLPAFRAIRLSDPAFEVEEEFPVCYVVPDRDRPQPGPVGLSGSWPLGTDISIWVAYELTSDRSGAGITSAETLRAMGLRYGVALLELLADPDGAATMGFDPGTGGPPPTVDYGPTITNRERGTWMSSILIRFSVQTVEPQA